VSWIDFSTDEISKNAFTEQNGFGLGDALQSLTIFDNVAYFVVGGSAKIEVASPFTFTSFGTITGFHAPRFMLPISPLFAYVSDLFSDKIYRLDLSNGLIIQEIPFPGWSEEMILIGATVYVTSPSRFGEKPSKHLYIVNTLIDAVSDSIELGFSPAALTIDRESNLWILCGGDIGNSIPGGLYRVNPFTREVLKEFPFSDTNAGLAPRITTNELANMIYYLKGDVYKIEMNADQLPQQPFIAANGRNFYGLAGDPSNGNIYVSDALDFQQEGIVYRYSPEGVMEKMFTVGIAPNSFNFR